MSLDFIAKASICNQAVERALPCINSEYNVNLTTGQLVREIGSSKIMQRQNEIRNGRIIGLSGETDEITIRALAQEIPRMYGESRQYGN
jgi:hypothetical protein